MKHYQYTEAGFFENTSVQFFVDPLTVCADSAVFTIQNNTNRPFVYGLEYILEVQVDEKWEQVKGGPLAVPLLALYVEPLSSNKETIQWGTHYGSLPVRNYRLIKQIENQKVIAPFTIRPNDLF